MTAPDPLDNLTINDLSLRVREALIEIIHDVDVIPDSETERVDQQMVKLQPYFEYFGRMDARRRLAEHRTEIARERADAAYKHLFLDAHAGLTLQRTFILVHTELESIRDALADAQ